MIDSPLRHRAFFQAASRLTEGSPEYRAMLAGLLVLRLLDKWPGAQSAADFGPVKRAVDDVDQAPIRRVLSSLVASIDTFSSGAFDTRATRLITYARFLDRQRYWEPAADTYATAIALLKTSGRDLDLLPMCYALGARCLRQVPQLSEAHELVSNGMDSVARQQGVQCEYWQFRLRVTMTMIGADRLALEHQWGAAAAMFQRAIDLIRMHAADEDDLLTCHERAAYCLRQIGRQDEAAQLILSGIAVADQLHDVRWSLDLRISLATMARQKGDLSNAEVALDAIVARVRETGDRDLLAKALHERGMVAYERKQFEQTVAFCHEAAANYRDQRMRCRALTDVAMVLGDLGEYDCARKTYRMLRQAPEADGETRTIAGLNLMEIAIKSGDRAEFDRYRAAVASEPMSGRPLVFFYLITGNGLWKFGERAAARAALQDGIVLAKRYQMYFPLVAEAEALLRSSHVYDP